MTDWNPEHEYFLRANPTGGRYQKFDYDTVMFLLTGGYIVHQMSRYFEAHCHYFERA